MDLKVWIKAVQGIAFRYQRAIPTHMSKEDLAQIGMIALLEAQKNYNAEKGASFSTYAYIRIKGAMIDAVRSSHDMPKELYYLKRKIEFFKTKLINENGYASDKDIAEAMSLSLSNYTEIVRKISRYVVITEEYTNDFNPEDIIIWLDNYEAALKAIDKLPPRFQKVLLLYLSGDKTLKEIGKTIGVGESRTSQLVTEAISLIRGKND